MLPDTSPSTQFAAVPALPSSSASVADLIAEGNRLLKMSDLDASEAMFRQAQADGAQPDASYGLGVIEFSRRHWNLSRRHFDAVLAANPGHANALYYRGLIAEEEHELTEACRFYNLALLVAPDHPAARKGRTRLSLNRKFRDLARTEIPHPVDRIGVYAHLLEDSTFLSAQCLSAIAALSIQASPPLSVYLGMAGAYFRSGIKKALRLMVFLLVVLVALSAALRPANVPLGSDVLNDLRDAISLGIIVLPLWWISWATLRSMTTEVIIDKGRLQESWGFLQKHRTNLELWRIQSIELHRSFINRLMGTGYFKVETHDKVTYVIPGPESGPKLDQLFQELLDVVYLLRANPIIKGIIY